MEVKPESATLPSSALEEGVADTAKDKEEAVSDESPSDCFSSCLQRAAPKHNADWWTLWLGILTFALAAALVFAIPYDPDTTRVKYVVPQPMPWEKNPLDAWDAYNGVGIFLLLAIFDAMYLSALRFMGKTTKADGGGADWNKIATHARGFVFVAAVATLAYWIGRNKFCTMNGLGYATLSILIGIGIGNSPFIGRLPSARLVAKDGEFFIKCSLASLAVEFGIIARVGLPAIVVAWVGSPLALILGYLAGTRLLKVDARLSLLICTGATWCGASAMSAVGSVLDSPNEDISLCISLVVFATVVLTYAQAYVALGTGMSDAVAGAWIGGSIDQTGNVVASAAIVSEGAMEVAAIVKIVLNSALGILATVIAFIWQFRSGKGDAGGDGEKAPTQKKKEFSWIFLWEKFPKFVLGFVICSTILSAAMPSIRETAEAEAMLRAVKTMNTWWFAFGFIGIGIGTDLKQMWHSARKSGVIPVYLIANSLDILISLGLSYLVF